MKNFIHKSIEFADDKNNFVKIFLCIIIFLVLAKIPTIFFTDMQLWDEGLYATRVLSIHQYGDFFDQTAHSVNGFYSSANPPVLIWIGYFFTLILGNHVWVYKIIPFIFALFCIFFTIKIGEQILSLSAGYFAAFMLAGNILFSAYCARFQFDYPYLFFILSAVYFFLKYEKDGKRINILYIGIIFGLFLMTKILVGIIIPAIFFISYLFLRKKIRFRFMDLVYICLTGAVIALPWHIYMIAKYGSTFLNELFLFNIYRRAVYGLEQNTKNSGVLFYINFLVSVIPYSLISFWALLKYLINFKKLSTEKIFITIWFALGLLIITAFKTKLETYSLLIMPQAALLATLYLKDLKSSSLSEKAFAYFMLVLNILWSLTYNNREPLKSYIADKHHILIIIPSAAIALIVIMYFSYLTAKKINPAAVYGMAAVLFFIGINIVHFVSVPYWADSSHLSEIKSNIEKTNSKNIVYIGSNFMANPQFSYYFSGLNIGWDNKDFTYTQVDVKKEGTENVKNFLDSLKQNNLSIIIEKDRISRTDYDSTYIFMPKKFNFVMRTSGYELYR